MNRIPATIRQADSTISLRASRFVPALIALLSRPGPVPCPRS